MPQTQPPKPDTAVIPSKEDTQVQNAKSFAFPQKIIIDPIRRKKLESLKKLLKVKRLPNQDHSSANTAR